VKIIISFLFVLLTDYGFSQESKRWWLGTGLTYCSFLNNPGINLNVTYRIGNHIHIGPDFSAILTRESKSGSGWTKRKELEFNFNTQYYFSISEKIKYYPFTGLNVSKITKHEENFSPDIRWVTNVNAGMGTELHFKNLRIFVEAKYVLGLSKYDLTTGILFPL
jgi:hypothetical protein